MKLQWRDDQGHRVVEARVVLITTDDGTPVAVATATGAGGIECAHILDGPAFEALLRRLNLAPPRVQTIEDQPGHRILRLADR